MNIFIVTFTRVVLLFKLVRGNMSLHLDSVPSNCGAIAFGPRSCMVGQNRTFHDVFPLQSI